MPRTFLADPAEFGVVYTAALRQNVPRTELPEFAASLLQHRAACAVREVLKMVSMTQKELGATRGHNEGTMSGYMTGAAPAPLVELLNWAHELGDSSILPDLDEVYAAARAVVR